MNEQNGSAAIRVEGMAPLMQVFDMPSSLHFYRDIVGFKITGTSGEGDDVDWVMLELSDITIMLNTAYEKAYRPAAPDENRLRAHNDVTLYFGCPNINSLYFYLTEKGLNLKEPFITGYGWQALQVTDPDGYKLCFHWPLKDS